MNTLKLLALVGTLLLAACGSSGDSASTTPDNGSIDLGTGSGVIVDNNTADADDTPTAPTDSGASIDDSGFTDAGTSDSGAADGGATDAGAGDAGASGEADASFSESDTTTGSVLVESTTDSVDGGVSLPSPDVPDLVAGTLTAADYDDHLNADLYHRYASDFLQNSPGTIDIPFLDMSNRITVNVTDQNGAVYEGATVQISDANAVLFSRRTSAAGNVHLYATLDELPEMLTVRVTGLFGSELDKTFELNDALEAGSIEVTVPEVRFADGASALDKPIDLLFAIDTTGSMGDELDYLQAELQSILDKAFENQEASFNVSLLFYRDEGDAYVIRTFDFTNDYGEVQRNLDNQSYGGGGDYPEAMHKALQEALTLSWQQDSHKIMFLIADAPPHQNKMRDTWNAARELQMNNVHIVPVAASGVAEEAEYVMRNIAALTSSRYLFLTDDSGVGNAHAEPDVACYVVTQLNRLMARVIVHLVSGVRLEPNENEIIRRVGDYNNGKCDSTQSGQ